MKAIVNRLEKIGTLNGVLMSNNEIKKVIFSKLKEGKAKLLIDTENTLMYEIL